MNRFAGAGFVRSVIAGSLAPLVMVLAWGAAMTPASAQEASRDLFTRLDANKDGKLTQDELPARQRPNFGRMDRDGNGTISREELAAFRQMQRDQNAQRNAAAGNQNAPLEPTHPNVSYGPHERNKFDLYLAPSDKPTPLVLYIHGGGFSGGDKSSLSPRQIRDYLAEGWSVAAINYRFTNVVPAPGQYLDCARALQTIRHNAAQWNINPALVASTGGSAGAGTSMWLAFHDDLADPDSSDPIARQSTRLTCIAVANGQCSYDPRFAEKIGIPRPNFERHGFFRPFYQLEEAEFDSPEAYRKYEAAAAITYLTKDDPPSLHLYSYANEDVTPETSLGLIVHHPRFGIALKEEKDKLEIECIVQYRDPQSNTIVRHGGGENVRTVNFLRKHFAAAAAP